LQCVALCSVLQCVAVCCSVQCVVVCCIQQRASALLRASTVSCCVGVLHSCESEFVYMLVCLRESAGVVVFVCICVCVVCLCLRVGVSVRLAIYVRICACMCAHVTGASDNVQPQVVRSHVTLFQTISLSVLHTRGTHTHTQIYIYILVSLVHGACLCHEPLARELCLANRFDRQTMYVSMYSQSHLGKHFRMLFQNSKFKARTSLLPRFSEKKRLSFQLSALKELTKMTPQVAFAVCFNACVNVWMDI